MKLELTGDVFERGSDAYEAARRKNFCVNAHGRDETSPAIIARPLTIADVQDSVKYANERNLTVNVRSGGHNWFGCFLRQDALLIDMASFDDMQIDEAAKTATVGPNCSGQALSQALEGKGLVFSSGHCCGVPLGGYLLGGGLGWFHEYFGYGVESVQSVQIVTPSGELIRASDTENKDWMHLFRGSASAFPGVVVSMTLKLHPLPAIMRSRMTFFPLDAFAKVSENLQKHRLDGSLPKNLEIVALLGPTPPPLKEAIPDEKVCIVLANCLADSEEEFASLTKPLDEMDAKPCIPPEDFKDCTISGLTDMMGKGYPENHRWIVRHYQASLETKVDFGALCEAYKAKAPNDTPCHLLLTISPNRPLLDNGVCSYPGFLIGADCGHEDEYKNVPLLQNYVNTFEELVEPIATKYNPSEHPVNKDTFKKCWDDADKLLSVRNKLDTQGRFFDPSQAEPSH